MASRTTTTLAVGGPAALAALFLALGIWQVERRAWKHALIERVDARVNAPAVAPPGPDDWPNVDVARDEYRHVRLTGTWLADRNARVQAVTEYGSGFWLMTPLRQADGATVIVNRGFVSPDPRGSAVRASNANEPRGRAADARAGSMPNATSAGPACDGPDPVEVTGLLRMTEPGGGFLRRNDPAGDRWYSRDVAAIAQARGLSNVAPFFVDAAAGPRNTPAGCPVGGLTIVAFHDSHAVYALTWFALALMSVAGAWQVVRSNGGAGRGKDVPRTDRPMVQDAVMTDPRPADDTPPDARAG